MSDTFSKVEVITGVARCRRSPPQRLLAARIRQLLQKLRIRFKI